MLDEPTQLKQREAVAEGPPIGAAATSGPQTRALLRVIFVILAVAAALWALYALEAVLLLVVLAMTTLRVDASPTPSVPRLVVKPR